MSTNITVSTAAANATELRFEAAIDTQIAKLSYGIAVAQRRIDTRSNDSTFASVVAEAHTYIAEHQPKLDVLHEVYDENGGWTRFFLVNNSGGHVHKDTSCSTCFVTTEYQWLTELSGLTEAEAVAAYGEILCSVCFPSAPVAWTTGESKATIEAREAKAAKKAEAAAKKAAKALIPDDIDGGYVANAHREPLWRERIKTLAAAKAYLTDGFFYGWDHPSYTATDRDAVAELLAGRLGTTAEEELAAAEKRAAKRR